MNFRDFKKNGIRSHPGFTYYKSKYTKYNEDTVVRCPNCGDITIKPECHIRLGCVACDEKIPKCLDHKETIPCSVCTSNDVTKLSISDYISLANRIYGGKYSYKPKKDETIIGIICKRHGELIIPKEDHLFKYETCKVCFEDNYKKKKEYITNLTDKYGIKYDYSYIKYVNPSSKVLIKCGIHGDIMISPIDSLSKICNC